MTEIVDSGISSSAALATRDPETPVFQHWRITRDRDNIVYAYIDRADESVNTLSRAVLEEFEQLVGRWEREQPRGVVLLSGKPTGFILGADVREFGNIDSAEAATEEIQRVHDMFNRLENLPFPTVAAIEGYCLGGGLELALACRYRIARDIPSTKFGFPETQLGIFPGFGGSVRSVRTIGGLKAMELMLTARQINARKARSLGLVDQVIGRHETLLWAARRAVLTQRRHRGPGLAARLSNLWPARAILAAQMRKKTQAKARPEHYPAPYRLIDTWEKWGGNRKRMMQAEAKAVGELMVSPTAQGLRRVFNLMERLKSEGKQHPFTARYVHVVGAGVMGGDIAAWCVLRGLEVSLQDREMRYIAPALKRAESLFRKRLRDPARVKSAMERLRPDPEAHLVGRADVVIEAIFEDASAKQELFQSLEPKLKPGAVLATNTSAIPLETLASVLGQPSRLIGLHFFNPVAKMPLAEVVGSDSTDPEALLKGAAFCHQISRFPLPVRSSPGFLVNRVLAPYMMTALKLNREGVPPEALDAAAEAFGMPMGPVELADTVGLDVCLMVVGVLRDDLPDGGAQDKGAAGSTGDSSKAEAFIKELVDAGKLGKKSGEGLYRWKDDKPIKNKAAAQGHNLSDLAERLITAYTDECKAALADDVVADVDLLDAGMVFGTGFPPFRGGPMYYLAHRDIQPTVPEPAEAPAPADQTTTDQETETRV